MKHYLKLFLFGVGFTFIAGLNSILFLVPIILAGVIIVILNLRKGWKASLRAFVSVSLVFISVLGGYLVLKQLYIKKFYTYVEKIKDHKSKTGKYPTTMKDEGPYYSLTGNTFLYRNMINSESPIMLIEVVPPFGRVTYNFATNTQGYLD